MSNIINEKDFEKINTVLKNKLNNLLVYETKDDLPEQLEQSLNSLGENITKIKKIIKEIEQNKKRELALDKLRERIEKRKIEGITETPETKEFEKTFYEIIDSFRPEGSKLYHEN